MKKSFLGYLNKQGISISAANKALEIVTEWRIQQIPLWPENNKRDEYRAGVIIGESIDQNKFIDFFAPVCPNYPSDATRVAQLGVDVGETAQLLIPFVKKLITPLTEEKMPFNFNMILADTEIDLEEVVMLLAGSKLEFLDRCKKSVDAIQDLVPQKVKVSAFSEFFAGTWHTMQNFWESVVNNELEQDKKFCNWLLRLAEARSEKYQMQFGRRLSSSEKIEMATRHYAQYLALGYWMRQYSGSILLNTDSPNLRAIRNPRIIQAQNRPSFLPEIENQRQRVPMIIL